ncbi:thiamine phosphate synthase [Nitratireductor thuwali]|uniref:Thiamine-phosphate synthase n=1 Tax=Nitratireductor thuwali TaxID=2267699 RepID=A0ABY5MKS8_9HYPH|nr:Thiamine-phosphate synthase [Nitratireductor thuwali]
MTETPTPQRCRIVLIAPPDADPARLDAALSAGDVASLLIPDYGIDEAIFESVAERLCRLAQEHGVAAIVAGSPRVATRIHADGIHFEGPKDELAELVSRYQERMAVGAGGAKKRDEALELGETQPDYMFFGRFGYDNKEEPHPRNLSLGAWWSEMIEIPAVVLAGSTVASIRAVAETGAEFVAVGNAVFEAGADPAERLAEANRLLDQHAPRWEQTG